MTAPNPAPKWTPRQRSLLIQVRDEGEVFFWDFPNRLDNRLLRSLDLLIDKYGVLQPGQTVKTPPSQDLPSTASYTLTDDGRSIAASL